jgi:Fe-S oxidoreductase
MISTTENLEPLRLDDELWEELMDITQGAISPCYQCGVCTATCPWGVIREDTFNVRTLIRNAQVGSMEGFDALWTCTSCAQCESTCPRGVPIAEIMRGLRYVLWKQRDLLEGLPSTLWSIFWNNNPWSQPPSQRAQWAQKLDLPLFNASQHEVLLYVGCTPSYDRRAQQISYALVDCLSSAGVAFGILGEEEPCCGESVLSLGHKPYFQELVTQASEIFLEKGVTKIVTISPHCYDVFLNHYPRSDNGFEPMHYTQYLANLIEESRLIIPQSLEKKITFHDPCFLGRWNQEYEAPRNILQSIPDLTLVEMERHGPEALCCGGGGGRMWMETPIGERFSDARVIEAQATGAHTIATACPYCITCLEDSIKAQNLKDLEILDIAEIVALAIER